MESIIESLVDGLITIDSNGIIVSINTAITHILGYSKSDITGKNISMLIPVPENNRHDQYIMDYLKTGKGKIIGFGREVIAQKKDGSCIEIFLSISPLTVENKTYFNGIIRDIQHQKQLEKELYISALSFQTKEAILITDSQNKIIRTNDAFTKITGYQLEDVRGKDPKVLSSGKQDKAFYKKMWHALRTNGFWEGELWNKKKNGQLYLHQERITVVTDPSGSVSHYIATFSDISQVRENEKRLEHKVKEDNALAFLLRESLSTEPLKAYLQKALDKLVTDIPWLNIAEKGGIFLIDYDADDDELELFVEHKLGPEINRLCHKVPFGKCLCGIAAEKKEFKYAGCVDEKHTIGYDGMEPHGHYNFPILQDGEVLGVIVLYLPHGALRDPQREKFLRNVANILGIGISRRYADEGLNAALYDAQMAKKELQNTMAEAENLRIKAEEATKAKSQFLASMSHEIRTPMNGVLGMTELLMQTELTDEQKEYALAVQNSGESLLAIINDILDFSKIEAGKLEIENIDFDLRDMLDHFIDMIAFRAQSKGLRLSCFLDPETTSWVNGDPTRIRQILVNLAGNAVKFTEKGEIAIYGKEISKNQDQHIIKFTVRDTGIGIPEKAREKLFQSFTQVDASTTRKYGGTGLGLAICKQLSGLMGGEIGVESESGKGSTFWFTIQLKPATSTPKIQEYTHINLKGKRAFVVDDNATNRTIIRSQLNSWGCTVTETDRGNKALEILQKDHTSNFDFMILDMEMPGMAGDELGQKIKTLPVYSQTPLIMLTSISLRGNAKKMQDIGFAGYLTKPVKFKHLKKCIQSALALKEENTLRQNPIITKYSISENERHSTKLLLAEDNRINQKVALKMLEKLGFYADCANNGQEAVDAVRNKTYDIILMDCQMPVKDGFEATREIRALQTIIEQPAIVAMTAFAMNGDREKCIDAGMDDYLSKPINQDALMKTLEKWIRKVRKNSRQEVEV